MKTKWLIIMTNALILASLLFFYFLFKSDFKVVNDRFIRTRLSNSVDIPFSLMEDFEEQIRRGSDADREMLKDDFLSLLSAMQYGKSGFFFIIDGSGRMVKHTLRPELSWWNMLYETDAWGRYIFRDLVNGAERDGEIYIETVWQSGYYEELMEEQLIYGRHFWPWDWVICTIAYYGEENRYDPANGFIIYIAPVSLLLIFNGVMFFLIKRSRDRSI